MLKKPYTYIVAGNVVALFRGETQLAGYDVVVDELNMQAETIRCQQLVLDQIAQALGLEKGDVDGISLAINRLQYDAETVECANMVLDDMKVPRVEGDMALSLVGRIKALAAGEAG